MELKEQPGTIVGDFCFKGIYQDSVEKEREDSFAIGHIFPW